MPASAPVTRFLDAIERFENLFQLASRHARAKIPHRQMGVLPATNLLQAENHSPLGIGMAQGIAKQVFHGSPQQFPVAMEFNRLCRVPGNTRFTRRHLVVYDLDQVTQQSVELNILIHLGHGLGSFPQQPENIIDQGFQTLALQFDTVEFRAHLAGPFVTCNLHRDIQPCQR